ncbi:MAG: OsmC family protein [Gemmatimonadota bacterium]
MVIENSGFELTLELQKDFQFLVDFDEDDLPPLLMDEPEPVGANSGPNAVRLMAAAVGNCLSASALFCMRKARVPVSGMRTRVRTSMSRTSEGRLRIGTIEVDIRPEVAPDDWKRAGRCLEVFEDYCVVSQSVMDGVEISVDVNPASRA